MNLLEHNDSCERDLIGAYLDGELDGAAVEDLEAHLKSCNSCAADLRAQQQLVCTLDAAFRNGFDLPEDFARVVKARAESDVSGVRKRIEWRRALQLIVLLALTSFALLGTAWQGSILQPVRTIARVTTSVLGLGWQTISDTATGFAVIVRLFGQAIILDPHRLGLLLLIILLGVSLLPRLIARYHRAQTVE